MPAHTPGPWRAEGRDIRQGQENLIAQVARQFDNNGGDDPIRNANARLIAAAPRMLDLLKHVPHNNMTATHRMVESVAGCPGCEARAILRDVEGKRV